MKESELCPCGSKKSYRDCCQLYHKGQKAENALLLMKSRYSAYAMGATDYICSTTHPKHVDAIKPIEEWKREIASFSRGTFFKKLEILKFEEGTPFSYVTFRVFLEQNRKEYSFQERSKFEKIGEAWLYLSGEIALL